ncbi:MAG: 1-deoxy-D-xylulose-5-phosphate reductoisomerase [Christensenellales bacterium]
MKNIAILGSTGSVGTQTLDVVRYNKDLKVTGLAAKSNIQLLEKQIREFRPLIAAVYDKEKAKELSIKAADTGTKIVGGMEGLLEVSAMQGSDMLVTAVVGMIGIRPTIAALQQGKDVALANKETLVTAGHIIMPLSEACHARVVPVDSEHSAILQCLNGESKNRIHKILLTASGGPFRGKTLKDLENVKTEHALNHPNWVMGKKITVDSSTLVNKALEVIEVKWLFDVELDQIQVLVQPQSIVHSMVEFIDGAIMAQLGLPDMRVSIQYALFYPERRYIPDNHLDLASLSKITFENPDMGTFRGLQLGLDAAKAGGSMPTVYNAANEAAVSRFLNNEIRYLEITEIIEACMQGHRVIPSPTVDEILETEASVHAFIRGRWGNR